MQQLIARLASLRVTVSVLIVLIAALAAGTIVESRAGTEVAQRAVYAAPWFMALLVAFAVNTLAAVLHRFPTSRWRIGFLLTHGGILVILLGGFLTADMAIRGQLPLWEGQQSASFLQREEAGTIGRTMGRALPFTVRLDSFEIDTYQGTQRPAMFRSRVTVIDPVAGTFPAVIEMNRPLAHRGYSFFQSSYQITAQGEQSVLAVSHDPGQPVVFAGYTLLVAGMIVVLVTRIAQQRVRRLELASAPAPVQAPARESRPAAAAAATAAVAGGERRGKGKRRKVAAVLLPTLLAVAGAARAAELADPATAERLRAIAVQHDGRVMPLDTLAREAVMEVTGSRQPWRGADPVALVLGWALYPSQWAREPLVEVGGPTVARLAGLPAEETHASFVRLVGDQGLRQALELAHSAEREGRSPTAEEKEALELADRLLWLQSFLGREALRVVPAAQAGAAWGAPPANVAPEALLGWLDQQLARETAPRAQMDRELRYNQLRPTRLAWWALLPATIAAAISFQRPRRWASLVATAGLLLGSAAMTWGIAVRWLIAGRIPATNMHESLLFLGAGAGLFGLLAAAVLRNRLVILNATAMAALTMLLVDLLPMDPFIHPAPPVLSGTPWLAIHVPIIMVSYAVLGLAVVLAHMQIGIEIFAPARRAAAVRMSELHYWYLHVGCILLITGILTGSIWGASSWGRYWGWDPKEVWSLIAFLAYMAILHARFDRMIGSFMVAAASIVAFLTILMTYIGVNYVLAAGLHSYGFGGGAVAKWLAAVAVAEATFLAVGWVSWRGRAREEGLAAAVVA